MSRIQAVYSKKYLGGIVFVVLAFCLSMCVLLPNSSLLEPHSLETKLLGIFETPNQNYTTSIGVATKPPQGLLDYNGWISYLIFLAIVFGIPAVIGLLILNCMCWYCCCRWFVSTDDSIIIKIVVEIVVERQNWEVIQKLKDIVCFYLMY